MEALRLREPGVAELRARAFRDLGGHPGQQRVGIAAHPREQIGDAHEPGVAHLLDLDLHPARDHPERRQRLSPRHTQRREITLEGLQGLFHASILHPPTDIRTATESTSDQE